MTEFLSRVYELWRVQKKHKSKVTKIDAILTIDWQNEKYLYAAQLHYICIYLFSAKSDWITMYCVGVAKKKNSEKLT